MHATLLALGGLCAVSALSRQIPRYEPRATAPPTFAPDNPEGLVFAGVRTDGRHAWLRPVMWRQRVQANVPSHASVPRMNPAEQQAMMQTLDALVAVLKATPTGSRGQGFWVNDSRSLGFVDWHRTPPAVAVARWPLVFESRHFPFYHEDQLRPSGQWQLSISGETESIAFSFNRLPGAMQLQPLAKEPAQGERIPVELFVRPRVTATFAGLPVYEGDLLVVARKGRDPWAPVSMARALAATLPLLQQDRESAERRLADLRRKNDEVLAAAWEQKQREDFEKNNGALRETRPANYAARFNSMEHYIRVVRQDSAAAANPQRDAAGSWYWNPIDAHDAALRLRQELTPAQAAQPACFAAASNAQRPQGGRASDGRYQMRGDLVMAGSVTGCREIVESNPAYFDLGLPRSAPQILTVDVGRCTPMTDGRIEQPAPTRFDAPPQGCFRHRAMWAEADWREIAALVVP
jgi:hypothetical protein